MSNKNTIQTSITVPVELWNKTQNTMSGEGIDNFSYFVQKSLRVNIQIIEKRNIREYLDTLNPKELELLKNEIKKRG